MTIAAWYAATVDGTGRAYLPPKDRQLKPDRWLIKIERHGEVVYWLCFSARLTLRDFPGGEQDILTAYRDHGESLDTARAMFATFTRSIA